MRHRTPVSLLSTALTAVLAACNLQTATPAPPPPEPPTAAPAPSAAAPAEGAPVSIAPLAPVMEVGSTWRLFNGGTVVAVPAGPFIMGNGRPESPIRTVTVEQFWIDQTEVTNRMYKQCVELGQCTPPEPKDNPAYPDERKGNLPVVGVTWDQAGDYCTFVGGRRPWEAEWEKAARGPEGNTYPWGEKPPACDLLNFDGCVRSTALVGTYPDGASYYDVMDMSGNAFEWVEDWYLSGYAETAVDNPHGPDTGDKRSVRSTAYNSDGFLTEAARRFSEKPASHRADLGFRCAYDDPALYAPFCTTLLVYGKDAGSGSGSGETLNEKCSLPSLEDKWLSCDQTNVWVDDGGGGISFQSGLEGCIDGGMVDVGGGVMKHLYTCAPGTPPVLVCGTCEYPEPAGGASCPDGYHQVGLQCVIDQGTPGMCPPGSEFDEAMMCCSALPGSGNAYDLCPPGMSYIPGPNPGDPGACVDYVAGGIKCAPWTVTYKTGCGDGNQPDCDEHPEDPRCGPCDPGTNPNGCGPGGGNNGPCPDGGQLICPTDNQCYCSK